MRISDWSSDVCSSDLQPPQAGPARPDGRTRWSCLNRPFAMPEPVHAWKFLNQPIFAQATATNPAKKRLRVFGGLGGECFAPLERLDRSEERRVGKNSGRTCITRWSPYH